MHDLANNVAAQGAADPSVSSALSSIAFPLTLMFVVFYFMLIRPMRKQDQARKEILKNLKKGDEVATNGGIWGRIQSVDEHVVVLDIADKTRVKVLRSQISGPWNPAGARQEKTGKK